MSIALEQLFKNEEEVKKDILADFAKELLMEVEKLVSVLGKEEFMKIVLEEESKQSEEVILQSA